MPCLFQLEPGALLAGSVCISCWGDGKSESELILPKKEKRLRLRRLVGNPNPNSFDP